MKIKDDKDDEKVLYQDDAETYIEAQWMASEDQEKKRCKFFVKKRQTLKKL